MEPESTIRRSIRIQTKNEQKSEDLKKTGQDSSAEATSLPEDSEVASAEVQEVSSLKQERDEVKEMGEFEHMLEVFKKEMRDVFEQRLDEIQ